MGRTILVTGGARSGKSDLAEKLVSQHNKNVLYIATAVPLDEEMKCRIQKHREDRPKEWDTYEGYRNIGSIIEEKGTHYTGILVDCITIMITNIFMDYLGTDVENPEYSKLEKAESLIKGEIEKLLNAAKNTGVSVVMVTNELGSGIVPENMFARVFRDVAGRMNQYIASQCDEVYLTVCGMPIKIK